METQETTNPLWNWITELGFNDPVQLTAAITGLLYVILIIRQKWYAWPIGIFSTLLYIYVLYSYLLYAETGTYVIYFFLMVYGWYHWLYGGEKKDDLPIRRMGAGKAAGLLGAALALSLPLAWMLTRFTNASLPYLDAANSMASLTGQWMQARKLMENWPVWILANASYVVMYSVKGMGPTAVLYAVFLVMAILGWMQWTKDQKAQDGA